MPLIAAICRQTWFRGGLVILFPLVAAPATAAVGVPPTSAASEEGPFRHLRVLQAIAF